MAEQLRPQQPEQQRKPEVSSAEADAQQKRLEREYSSEKDPQNKIETSEARSEVLEALAENEPASENEKEAPAPSTNHRVVTPREKDASYKATMRTIQKEMTPSARNFSKFIHNPVIENVSEITGKTVARPNSILFGSLGAFFVVLGVYLTARYMGFRLSGSEFIVVFVLGWFAGLVFDLLRKMVTGK